MNSPRRKQTLEKNEAPKTVVVLGMARSGTSITAGILNYIGVNMGESMKEPSWRNPKGYYEDEEFIELHVRIFAAARKGSSYWDPPSKEQVLAQRDAFEAEIIELVSRKQANSALWGWKMPWTNLTIEMFLPYLQNPHIVVVFRNPLGNAHSFVKHNGIVDLFRALMLVNFYNERILSFLAEHPDVPRKYIAFEELVREPVAVAGELANFIDCELSKARAKTIQEFVIPRDQIEQEKQKYRGVKYRASHIIRRIIRELGGGTNK